MKRSKRRLPIPQYEFGYNAESRIMPSGGAIPMEVPGDRPHFRFADSALSGRLT
jgi:hypothetical protein